jgi:hypothetical protein
MRNIDLQPGDMATTDYNGRRETVRITDRRIHEPLHTVQFRVLPALDLGDRCLWYGAGWFEPVQKGN